MFLTPFRLTKVFSLSESAARLTKVFSFDESAARFLVYLLKELCFFGTFLCFFAFSDFFG